MAKIQVAVVGGSGYTGLELLRILSLHPHVQISSISSRQYKGKAVTDIFPSLKGMCELIFSEPDSDAIKENADAVFTALPHQTAMEFIPSVLGEDRKVIDLSADFRFRDPTTYETWYVPHTEPDLLGQAVYGLPELYHDRIKDSFLVGNPGCYPTSVILGLAPLLKERKIDITTIIADSKSGVSGAGRSLNVTSLYCEANEGIKAYKIAQHRHMPEIEQELSILAGESVTISFTPHLTPMTRGILSTIYAKLSQNAETEEMLERYRTFYKDQPFVRIYPQGAFPSTAYVRGTNFIDIGLQVDPRTKRIVITSAIDNLVKGASGQAVQNMNIMYGLDQSAGLNIVPVYP